LVHNQVNFRPVGGQVSLHQVDRGVVRRLADDSET